MNSLGPSESLQSMTSQERLAAYQLIIDGCHHIWSKNKMQREKALQALQDLVPLTKKDPYFLAHLTSHIMKTSKSNDLRVFLTYVASLSSADGTPFSPGSEFKKPNLRYVSVAALQMLDPKLVERIVDIADMKYGVPGYLNEADHFPTALRTAVVKYLRYREAHPEYLVGIKRAGLGQVMRRLYRKTRTVPSDEAAKILRWKQKDRDIDFGKRDVDFTGLTDLQIAEMIREKKLPYIGVMGELARISKKVSPVIAVAMLEQATGNQAVIMHATFADAGILNDPEVMKLYEEKVKSAKTALDRVERIKSTRENALTQTMLSQARAESRQKETAGLGKVFIHLDMSPSMERGKTVAEKSGAIMAECVNDPANNFRWGIFHNRGEVLPTPTKFVKEEFEQILFGRVCQHSTDAFALYSDARQFGADVDIMISDGGHNTGDLGAHIRRYHERNPNHPKPKSMLWVRVDSQHGVSNAIKDAYEENGIPVAVMEPSALTESALVVEAVRNAMLGPVATVDTIMESDLLELPKWYFSLKANE